MTTQIQYIDFVDVSAEYPARKTKTYEIRSKVTNAFLGKIEWYTYWRRYCFFPNPNTVLDVSCMKLIIEFINLLMQERKDG